LTPPWKKNPLSYQQKRGPQGEYRGFRNPGSSNNENCVDNARVVMENPVNNVKLSDGTHK
jgi:hypothetical protein